MQVGDIVSVMDEDEGIYFAQIRGFLQDQYCQKSAVITWLVPTVNSPRDCFDPSTYILGKRTTQLLTPPHNLLFIFLDRLLHTHNR